MANGEVERFIKTLKKSLKISRIEQTDYITEMNAFLRNYRATSHCSTNVSPYEALFKTTMTTRLPDVTRMRYAKLDSMIKLSDDKSKSKMKAYADTKRNNKSHGFEKGDTVLLKNEKLGKL